MRQPAADGASFQLTYLDQPHSVVEELRTLDVEGLSPLDAITKLFELKRRVVE